MAQVKIMVFGQLMEIVTTNEFILDDVLDTDALVTKLTRRYPALAQKKYMIAVDKKAITTNTLLTDDNTVALLPPFSGG